MYEFPRGPKKIAATIKRYELQMRREQAESGFISDGFGKRYLLGTLYLLLGDVPGALKSYEWFERTFEDDAGEPFHCLSWTLALYRGGRVGEASRKLRQTMLLNLYLIPHMLGLEQDRLDIWHSSNWAEESYLQDLPPEIIGLWDADELKWVQRTYETIEFRTARSRFIEIFRRLKNEPVGSRRTDLVDEAYRIEKGET